MKPAFVVLLLASACGQPFAPTGACTPQGWGSFYTTESRPCECIARLAVDALKTASEAAHEPIDPSRVDVWLWSTGGPLREGKSTAGLYHPEDDSIESERFARSLAHELLHRVDTQRGASREDTANHKDWDVRGWREAGDEFWRRWSPDSSPTFCW